MTIQDIEELDDYTIIHTGEGKFQVITDDNELKDAGPNLCGMIRYTYFEDFTVPEVGWSTTRRQLYTDYIPKVTADVHSGKIKPKS